MNLTGTVSPHHTRADRAPTHRAPATADTAMVLPTQFSFDGAACTDPAYPALLSRVAHCLRAI